MVSFSVHLCNLFRSFCPWMLYLPQYIIPLLPLAGFKHSLLPSHPSAYKYTFVLDYHTHTSAFWHFDFIFFTSWRHESIKRVWCDWCPQLTIMWHHLCSRFERERTCPLCRALVRPADLRSFGDGSTSLFFQLFWTYLVQRNSLPTSPTL